MTFRPQIKTMAEKSVKRAHNLSKKLSIQGKSFQFAEKVHNSQKKAFNSAKKNLSSLRRSFKFCQQKKAFISTKKLSIKLRKFQNLAQNFSSFFPISALLPQDHFFLKIHASSISQKSTFSSRDIFPSFFYSRERELYSCFCVSCSLSVLVRKTSSSEFLLKKLRMTEVKSKKWRKSVNLQI